MPLHHLEVADGPAEDFPAVEDLSDENLEKLKKIKTFADIESVKLLAQWSDDSCPCIGVEIDGMKVSFWWMSPDYAAAFLFPDSKLAQEMIVAVIVDRVNDVMSERNAAGD